MNVQTQPTTPVPSNSGESNISCSHSFLRSKSTVYDDDRGYAILPIHFIFMKCGIALRFISSNRGHSIAQEYNKNFIQDHCTILISPCSAQI